MRLIPPTSATVLVVALGFGFGFGVSLKGEEGGGASGAAAAPPAALASPRALEEGSSSLRSFEEVFVRETREMGAVGAGLVVVKGSRTLLSSYVGLADRERGVAASPDTIWHWASITKTFTAVRVMQLRDRGKLALSDPIAGN